MRGNIIEELYYGNIDPQDRGYRPKSPVKKASDSLNDLEETPFIISDLLSFENTSAIMNRHLSVVVIQKSNLTANNTMHYFVNFRHDPHLRCDLIE